MKATMTSPARLLPAMAVAAPPSSEFFFRRFRASIKNCSVHHDNISLRGKSRNGVGKIHCSLPNLESEVDYETCELVSGTELFIGEGDNGFRAYLMKAVKNNNGNGILLLSDEFGFEDSSTREFAYRVSCSGYNVLVPDIFRGNPWKVGRPKGDYGPWAAAHSKEQVSSDIAQAAQWLEEEFVAAGISKKLGIIGFGFGADRLIETLANDLSGRFGTGACFYGSEIGLGQAHKIRVPLLFICGGNGPESNVSVVREIARSIAGAKVVVYEGRGSGFAHRPASQEDDDDAEDAFAVARAWLHELLPVD